MEMDSYYSGEIKTGNFIIVACSNSWLDLGFFLGQGNTVQYYLMTELANRLYKYKSTGIIKPPKKSFYNTSYPGKIAKYSLECLSPNQLVIYEEAIEMLKLLKIIKE